MGIKIEFRNRREQEPQPEDRVSRAEDFHVGSLETRLQDLSERLPNFNGQPELVSLENGPHIFDPALDLRVKVEAVRWMLRVAKHVQDPARERILLTVNSSLDQLETAVNEHTHAA
jgi:hypothetical protein